MDYGFLYAGLAVIVMLAMPLILDRMKDSMAILAALPFLACFTYLAVINHEDILYEMHQLPETVMYLVRFGW